MNKIKSWIDRVAPTALGVIWCIGAFSISIYVVLWSIKGILRLLEVL